MIDAEAAAVRRHGADEGGMERDRLTICERDKDLANHGCEGSGHVALPAVPMPWEVRGRVIQDVGREEVRHLVRSADAE